MKEPVTGEDIEFMRGELKEIANKLKEFSKWLKDIDIVEELGEYEEDDGLPITKPIKERLNGARKIFKK